MAKEEPKTPDETAEKAPTVEKRRLTEIEQRRNMPWRRFGRFARTTWWMWLAAVIGLGAWISQPFLNFLLNASDRVFYFMMLMSFAVMQFVAIFWFMARSKTEVVVPEDPKALTFDDYKGQDKLIEMVKQWMSLLSDREKFQEMGGQFLSGLLLYGEPGTGKTMLAKCMAGESGTAFISIEGSGFRAMFFGVDILKMMAFINKAKKLAKEYGACIAFIDEIDAVGASRGGVMGGGAGGMMGGMGGGTGALTRLLYEMDGVETQGWLEKRVNRVRQWFGMPIPKKDWHVLFVGSTNRPDVLDPALVRPGRLDRRIHVAPPDAAGRRSIIEYYLNKIRCDDDIDVEAIVSDTVGQTPAQIMSAITKDAVRMAMFDKREKVTQRDVDLALQEQAMGLENPIEELPEDQKRQIAYHEAGHAIATYYMMRGSRIVRATIVRRGAALGYVYSTPEMELHSMPVKWYIRRIFAALAGDVATKIWSGEPWVGTASDFAQVRNNVIMLANNGFFGPPISEFAQETKEQDKEGKLSRFWKQCEIGTYQLLVDHWAEVDALAKALIKEGDLSGRDVIKIIQKASGVKERLFEEHRLDEFVPPLPYEMPKGMGNGYAELEMDLEKEKQKAPSGG
jgi:cell division protease FtsH